MILLLLSSIGLVVFFPVAPEQIKRQALLAMGITVLLLVGAWLLLVSSRISELLLTRVVGKVSPRLEEKLRKPLDQFRAGVLLTKEQPRRLYLAVACSVLIWFNEAIRLFIILKGLGVDTPTGRLLPVCFFASSIATIVGMSLPGGAANAAMIGAILTALGIGTVELAAIAGLVAILTSFWISIPTGGAILLYWSLRPTPPSSGGDEVNG